MDDENKQLTDADHVESMLTSTGWGIVYDKLAQRILDLQNINNLDLSKPETLSIQLMARKMAVDEIWAWVKGDVTGFVEQSKLNAKKIDEKIESFIGRQ